MSKQIALPLVLQLFFTLSQQNNISLRCDFNKNIFTFSIMINNNPYNLPQRPTNKQNRIYTQVTTVPFRPQISQSFSPYNQYKARQAVNLNQMSNITTINVEQANTPFRPTYPGVRNDLLHFVPSPKNNNSNGNPIPNNFNPSNSKNRGNGNMAASCEKKQIGSMRESFGISAFDIKQINQKIELISLNVRATEKRLGQLQKNNSNVFLPNNSKLMSDGQSTLNFNSQATQLISKYQMQWIENMNKVKQEIVNIKEQLKNNKTSNKYGIDFQRIVIEKCKQVIDSNKGFQNHSSSVRNGQEQIKKQIDGLRFSLEEKIKKNFEFLTSVIGRIQRELHTSLLTIQPNFKQSALKCSTTAILLRFVQCFKVRKHSAKNGQIKITLTDNTYYIDGQGYLLDKEQFYIVDNRDCRVRLEEKHIRLLKEQNILL